MKMFEALELESLYEKTHSISLPLRTTYKLAKLFQAVQKEKEFYSAQHQKIIDEYIMRDENGDFVYTDETRTMARIVDGKVEECNKAISDLMNMEIDFTFNSTFTVDELDNLSLTIDELRPLLPYIE